MKTSFTVTFCLLFALCFGSIAVAEPQIRDDDSSPPLSRVREGGTPYDANQSLLPFAVQAQGVPGPGGNFIASPPEYTPVKGVLFKYAGNAWPSVVTALVASLTGDPSHDEIAYVVVTNTSQMNSATNAFTAAGADMSKVVFFTHPSESIWLRDYGPHFVWTDGTLNIVDSHYYPTRPNDNFIPTLVGDDDFIVDTADMGLYYSGGNFQPGPDRQGFVTSLVNLDNPASAGFNADLIAELYNRFQGIDTLHVMPQLPFSVDGTGHIDMWFYMIDEDTVIISEFIPGSNNQAINITNNAVTYMEDLGFEVFRPKAWNSGGVHYTYANAFRVNDRIFIPCYGTQLAPGGNAAYNDEDAFALAAWEDAVGPDIEIVPIQCISIIPAAGAIHCIVMQVPRYTDAAPAVTILSPQEGDLWISGNPQTIRWSATDTDNATIPFVSLYYSTDDGNNWQLIEHWPNSGSYTWDAPLDTSPQTRIRVVATSEDLDTGEYISGAFNVATGAQTVYDYSTGAGSDKFAYGWQTSNWSNITGNVDPVTSQLTSSNYGRLATSNATGGDGDQNRYISPTPSGSWETTHVFEFQIAEDLATVSEIEAHWEGYADRCTQAELYVWDFVAQQWGDGDGLLDQNRYMDSWAGNADGYLDGTLRGDLSRFVDIDGTMFFLVYGERNGDESFHDYMSLTVKQADVQGVQLDSFNIIRGIQVAGDLSDLDASDDEYLQFQPGITLSQSEPPVWIEFEGTLADDSPTYLAFQIESNANTVGITQTTEMFNYVTGLYEQVDSRAATTVDSVAFIEPTGEFTRFVELGTGHVKSRVGWKATGIVLLYPWTISVDHVTWDLDP